MAAQRAVAGSLDIPWPQPAPRRRVGKPSRQDYYTVALYAHIHECADIPPDVPAVVPGWWQKGMNIVHTEADEEKDLAHFTLVREAESSGAGDEVELGAGDEIESVPKAKKSRVAYVSEYSYISEYNTQQILANLANRCKSQQLLANPSKSRQIPTAQRQRQRQRQTDTWP